MKLDDKIKQIAELQLHLAVINGESWAIKHVLGGTKLDLVGGPIIAIGTGYPKEPKDD